MLGTFHSSPRLKVIASLQLGPWNFGNCKLVLSSTSSQPACLSALSHRRQSGAAAAAQGRPRATSCLRWPPTPRAEAPHRFYPSRCALLALPRSSRPPPAATSPPPWMARCSPPEPYLSCTLALQEPPQIVPLVLLPFPQPQTPERRRRSARTPASLTPPSTRLFVAHPLALTPPSAPPQPRATHPPLLLAQNSPKRYLRRSPPPPTRLLSSRRCYKPPRPQSRPSTCAQGSGEPPTPLHPRRR